MPRDFKEGIRRCNFQDGLGMFPEWKREKYRYKPVLVHCSLTVLGICGGTCMDGSEFNLSNEWVDDFQVESLCICSLLSQRRRQPLRSQIFVVRVRPWCIKPVHGITTMCYQGLPGWGLKVIYQLTGAKLIVSHHNQGRLPGGSSI